MARPKSTDVFSFNRTNFFILQDMPHSQDVTLAFAEFGESLLVRKDPRSDRELSIT
jgi:hypothetical protein